MMAYANPFSAIAYKHLSRSALPIPCRLDLRATPKGPKKFLYVLSKQANPAMEFREVAIKQEIG
jgi:hypothetical protein